MAQPPSFGQGAFELEPEPMSFASGETVSPPSLKFRRGDVDCALNVLMQVSGTLVSVIGALEFVLVQPFLKPELPQEEVVAMRKLATDLIYGQVVAGMSVTMLFGCLYYSWMAWRLMKKEGRSNVCVLPYGVNTPAAFAFTFNIVGKVAHLEAEKGSGWEEGITNAWRAGCAANVVAGLIAAAAGLAGPLITKAAPKASLLIALAGIGFTYLGINQFILSFRVGYAGLLPLGAALVLFFGNVRTYPIPSVLLVVLLGCFTGWTSGRGWPDGVEPKTGGTADALKHAFDHFQFYPPSFLDSASFRAMPEVTAENISLILPVSLTAAVGTLLSVYAAHDAGDVYPIRESMVVDGVTTVVAGLFGSPLGTCVYIGHPQFKAQGGRIWYSFLSGACFCFLACTGLFAVVNALVPPYGVAPVLLFVGIAINQDAFSNTPRHQLPAAILGLFPTVAEWIVSQWPRGSAPPPELKAVANGALLSSVIWTALGVVALQRQFKRSVSWSVIAAGLAAFGFIHQERVNLRFENFSGADGHFSQSPCAFFSGYLTLAVGFLVLAALQACGAKRVKPPRFGPEDDDTADEVARGVSRAARGRDSFASVADTSFLVH